jgi:hypothetical protein
VTKRVQKWTISGKLMNEPFNSYLTDIQKKQATGVARGHAYRPPLETLLRALNPQVAIINDILH